MNKKHRIIYWIATAWLALGMASTGIVQLLKTNTEVTLMHHLGYPPYVLTILGCWKLLGVIAILIPGTGLLKEWTYAGFFFAMSGAIISHLAMADSPKDYGGAILLVVLTVLSWLYRPASRKITATVPVHL